MWAIAAASKPSCSKAAVNERIVHIKVMGVGNLKFFRECGLAALPSSLKHDNWAMDEGRVDFSLEAFPSDRGRSFSILVPF